MPACLTCTQDFRAATRGGRAQLFCSPSCRVVAANARRATTRKGRLGVTNPQPISPTPPTMPPSVDRSPSDCQDTPNNSLKALLDKAHSRVGVTAWEIATIAKLRGISAWAPLRVIIARE
jgi:hypothetical protein